MRILLLPSFTQYNWALHGDLENNSFKTYKTGEWIVSGKMEECIGALLWASQKEVPLTRPESHRPLFPRGSRGVPSGTSDSGQ